MDRLPAALAPPYCSVSCTALERGVDLGKLRVSRGVHDIPLLVRVSVPGLRLLLSMSRVARL